MLEGDDRKKFKWAAQFFSFYSNLSINHYSLNFQIVISL